MFVYDQLSEQVQPTCGCHVISQRSLTFIHGLITSQVPPNLALHTLTPTVLQPLSIPPLSLSAAKFNFTKMHFLFFVCHRPHTLIN